MQSTKLNEDDVGVDPFKVASTIASFCNYIFRRNFLKPQYNALTYNTVKQMYQYAVHAQHRSRIDFIKKELPDYKLVELWEHDWDINCKMDPGLVAFLSSNSIEPPLVPRDSLYGGRTQAYVLYHKCEKNERIDYIDYTVNSLNYL